ncbi:MAG: Tnp 1-associated [Planctomycetota bacterium]
MAGLNSRFEVLKDARVAGRCEHLLGDMVAISMWAALCGAEDFPDIEGFGKRRQDRQLEFLVFRHSMKRSGVSRAAELRTRVTLSPRLIQLGYGFDISSCGGPGGLRRSAWNTGRAACTASLGIRAGRLATLR